jgi:MFS transporter, DHA1 family, tetracycline resistance protein
MQAIRDIFSFMRGNVLVMTICECVWRSTVDIIWPFLPLYVMELGGRYETIGIIMAVGNGASLILYPVGGYIADYQGRIKLISSMTFVYGCAFLITAFTNTWEWLAVGIFIQSLVSFYFPARQALIADSIPPVKRGIGFATTVAIPSAFGLAAPKIGAYLIDRFGMVPAMKGLYLMSFFVASGIALFRFKYLKETVDNPNKLELSLATFPSLILKSYKSVFSVLREVPKRLWTLSIIVSMTVLFGSLTSSFWIVRAQEVIGLTVGQWANTVLVSGLVSVVLGIPAGSIVDRYSKKMIAGVCMLLGAGLTYAFLHATTYNHVLMMAVAATVINSFMNPAFQSLFANMTPKEQRGRVLASIGGGGVWLMRGAYGSGVFGKGLQTIGLFLSGYIYNYNNSFPWLIMSVSMFVFGILFLLLVEEPKVAEL